MAAAAATDDYDAATALAEFHATRGGVLGLIDSGAIAAAAAIPPLFLAPNSRLCSPPIAPSTFVIPTVDLSLPRPSLVAAVRAAAQSCGFFYVTNHGILESVVSSAVSAVRAFHELPLAVRSSFYSPTPVDGVLYYTMPNDPPRRAADPEALPVLPWRDTLIVSVSPGAGAGGGIERLPSECRDALKEYRDAVSELGKETLSGLLSEAMGVGAGRMESAVAPETALMACHYYLPCPEPARVVGSLNHTDAWLFAVLAQDEVGGLMARVAAVVPTGAGAGDEEDQGEQQWVEVPKVAGALLVNVGDVLKVLSNDGFRSVLHEVRIKSREEARASVAVFFNPGDSAAVVGPLPELVKAGETARYRSFTVAEFMAARKELGHGGAWVERFRACEQEKQPLI
ncbi:1-aminocyclopropane-1-carboxylate oxidase homolog 1 [Brachypodium distachyon]|uniref:Fe2OG dioxygenase domain-containing protein n=1 Tax=Brachypodium distachyon TaxID=15368 RepID=A0A2K2D2L9_BRADI|nr:1-aminocyclopropane-1-carboxylate oxidase homolog 1 [Brachypodium distachyon]PNT68515.1 hypothetical protein BRADI_3g41711v3 [Brachypodium distachyon]|eukprot:XP_024317765.1 1-aminocyclopropane-1-carboxylate oxidase homolog 1 [Brachypodium distachyon]